jgi:trans-aconitate 2-methyltransferase
MPDAWSPTVYGRFAAERSKPFFDLLSLVALVPIERAVDLGCGSGELTAAAAEQLSIESMSGIDNSSNMLADAAPLARPGLRFEQGDIGSWSSDGDVDLVLANAALHWVPDHAAVLWRWTAALRPRGQLAVQVPANADHASHQVIEEVAHQQPFLDALGGTPPADPVAVNVLAPERYAELLYSLGYEQQHVRLQVYPHVLESTASVVDWVSGTTLTRFRSRLSPDLYDEFVARYRARLLEVLGDRSPYLYAFKRILMWARLPS